MTLYVCYPSMCILCSFCTFGTFTGGRSVFKTVPSEGQRHNFSVLTEKVGKDIEV